MKKLRKTLVKQDDLVNFGVLTNTTPHVKILIEYTCGVDEYEGY